MRFTRPMTLAASVVAAVALLGACGGNGSTGSSASPSAAAPSSAAPSATPTPSPSATKIPTSSNLDAITVTGAYGKEPKVTVKAPWAVDKTRVKVLEANEKGAVAKSGQSVTVDYYGVNARTGKKFDDSFSRGMPATFPLDQVVPGFKKGLEGQHQGSRVLIAMPGVDGYDGSGGNPQAGINVGDTLLFVVDLVAVPLTGPDGTDVDPKAGLPKVSVDKGVPTVEVLKSAAPTKLEVQPLIKGRGAKVTAEDAVSLNYRWTTWEGREVETTYGKGATNDVPVSTLFQGLQQGLVGQTVGSRVLIIAPPAVSYPNGNTTPKIEKTDTQVLVVDILFAAAGQ